MGLKDLKKIVRAKFGKVKRAQLGKFYLVNTAGQATSVVAKSTDLKDQSSVSCSYVTATGNGNLGDFVGRGFDFMTTPGGNSAAASGRGANL